MSVNPKKLPSDRIRSDVAAAIKSAFYEGWGSYSSPCNPMTGCDDEWKESAAKELHDALLSYGAKS